MIIGIIRYRSRMTIWLFLILVFGYVNVFEAVSQEPPNTIIIVINLEGNAQYVEPGWQQPQELSTGDIINFTSRLTYLNGRMLVLCPDGQPKLIQDFEIIPNATIRCTQRDEVFLIPVENQFAIGSQRGDTNELYVVAPRATVVRSKTFDVEWNPIEDVDHYVVNILQDFDEYSSGRLEPENVLQDNIATWQVTNSIADQLKEDVPYTIEICATLLSPLSTECTTGRADSADSTFYISSFPHLQELEGQLAVSLQELGFDTDSYVSLYAKAVLISQPIYPTSTHDSEPLGLYYEASQLLNQILDGNESSTFSESAPIHVLLGNLYLKTGLLLLAQEQFEEAQSLANNEHHLAKSYLGLGYVTGDLSYFEEALDISSHYVSPEMLSSIIRTICQNIGDECQEIRHCVQEEEQC